MFSYKKPELHDIVFVKLKDIKSNDMGNYVDLIDYDNNIIYCRNIYDPDETNIYGVVILCSCLNVKEFLT